VSGIFGTARALGLPGEIADDFVARGVTLDQARAAMVDLMAARQNASMTRNLQARVSGGISYDAPEAVRSQVVDALAHRFSGGLVPLPDEARRYGSLSILDMGRALASAAGARSAEMSASDTAGWLLSSRDLGGLQSTSDFPKLLVDAANKSLLAGFERLAPALVPVARRIEVNDFRMIYKMRLGELPDLELLNEHGEVTSGSLSEERESYSVKSYAKMFGFTKQLLVNDDTSAFTDFLSSLSSMAATLLGDKLAAALTDNATMADGVALFAAGHGNIGVAGALSVNTLGSARLKMRQQTGPGGKVIQVEPKHLVVGPEIETLAEQVLTTVAAATQSDANPFAGRLTLLVEPRLTGTTFYLFSAPSVNPVLEYAELNGSRPMSGPGPRVASREGWRIQGIEFLVSYDVGTGVIGHRGVVRSPGA
jgi:hypothetical protein